MRINMARDKNEICKVHFIHLETVKAVEKAMPTDEVLYELADFFKIVGDATRIMIIYALFVSEMCVCDLSNLLNISQSAVSHQLKTLRQAQIVKYRKEGKVVFYSLKDEHIKRIIDAGLIHTTEGPVHKRSAVHEKLHS
jgi:DNA-binding transcriptional ArsR family regulator